MIATSKAQFQPQGLAWFACHELLLAWRDWLSMMTAGRGARERAMLVASLIFVVAVHALAYSVLAPVFKHGAAPGKLMLVVVGATMLLTFFMMLSQALESVTRAFYSRSDLELILSSPVSPRYVFAVRIAALTLTTTAMTLMLVAPFVHIAAVLDNPGWLLAYPVMLAGAMIATGTAVWVMMTLFHLIGAARTRLVAQIVAAVIGASFLIGIQVVAIVPTILCHVSRFCRTMRRSPHYQMWIVRCGCRSTLSWEMRAHLQWC